MKTPRAGLIDDEGLLFAWGEGWYVQVVIVGMLRMWVGGELQRFTRLIDDTHRFSPLESCCPTTESRYRCT